MISYYLQFDVCSIDVDVLDSLMLRKGYVVYTDCVVVAMREFLVAVLKEDRTLAHTRVPY